MTAPLPSAAQDETGETAAASEPLVMPRFRHVDLVSQAPALSRGPLTLIGDDDFAPFSYAGPGGEARGIAVEAAQAACADLQLTCTIRLLPWHLLTGSISERIGDAVIAGLKTDAKTLAQLEPTRPIYRSLGRFAVRNESGIADTRVATLAGKRIGAVAGSGHEAWLKRHFGDAEIVPYPSFALAQEALRTAKVDVLFGDGLGLVYWMRGAGSQNCCRFIDGAFIDETLFSPPFAFFVRRGDSDLRRAFDLALDRLQESGEFARIFGRYVPAKFW